MITILLLAAVMIAALMPSDPVATEWQTRDIHAAVVHYASTAPRDGRQYGLPSSASRMSDVECGRTRSATFRRSPVYICTLRFRRYGETLGCYAVVGGALYAAGGCFDPRHDLGLGRGRLLQNRTSE